MFIVSPNTQRVLTLKPDMKVKPYNNKSVITWVRKSFEYDKVEKIYFSINKNYNDLISDFNSDKIFIISEWSEIKV